MERHILLIDDDTDELDLFLEAIKEMPGMFRCSYLESALNAEQTIEALNPDIIFLDVNMPIITGPEFLMRIKDTGICARIPVILYSTNIDPEVCKKAKELGAAKCIKKPVKTDAFLKMLKDVLETL
jgi:DNA-binding NtrC family response regulator